MKPHADGDTVGILSPPRTARIVEARVARCGLISRGRNGAMFAYYDYSEIASDEMLESIRRAPVQLGHGKRRCVGLVLLPRIEGGRYIRAQLVIDMPRGARAIDLGMSDISCGWEVSHWELRTLEGLPCAVARGMRCSHVALVRAGTGAARDTRILRPDEIKEGSDEL